jgi:heptosyltransferase-2
MLYTTRVEYNDKQHAAQTFLDSVRVIDANYTSEGLIPLTSNAQDKKKIDSILKKIPTSSKLIGFVPGAAESAKARMLPKDMYIKIANELASDSKYFILFIGSKEEEKLIHEILDKITYKGNVLDLSGKTTLRELFYLISKIDLLVTNDTGPLHIASAQNTKTIGLFGPNTPVRFGPYNKKSVSFYKKSSCTFSPCINVHKGIVPDCLYDIEDKNYQKCMKSITAREIVLAIKRLV